VLSKKFKKMGSCFKNGSCVKIGSRLFVVGSCVKLGSCQNWFTIVRGWVHVKTGSRLFVVGSCVKTGSRLFVVGSCVKIGSRLFVVQKHSSGDFNTKNIKENAVSSILCLYLYSLPSSCVSFIYSLSFLSLTYFLIDCNYKTIKT
jgi:hypothetical protein